MIPQSPRDRQMARVRPPSMQAGAVGGLRQAGNVGGTVNPRGFDPAMSYDPNPIRANQMMAAAAPNINLNSPALPDWQRYQHVMNQQGVSMGGNMQGFDPMAASPQYATDLSHNDYAKYVQAALRGLKGAR